MSLGRLIGHFVIAGGLIGGATTGLVLIVWSVATGIAGGYFHFEPLQLFQATQGMIYMSLLGIPIGSPSAAATASIYAISARVRRYGLTALIGAGASAVWGFLVAVMTFSGGLDASAFWAVACFALSGAVAAMVCHGTAKRWSSEEQPA